MAWTAANPVTIGNATKKSDFDKVWDNADYLMSAFDAAGDMAYASAANTIAKLAAGAANLKLFMNAGATAPEWAAGIKIVSYTRVVNVGDGTVAYTGAGFKPSGAIIIGAVTNTTIVSIGFTDFTSVRSIAKVGTVWEFDAGACISAKVDSSNYERATVASAGSNGMLLTWAQTGSPTGTFSFSVIYFR